jgi:hypothetical protein
MMQVLPFRAAHLWLMTPQPAQAAAASHMTPEMARALEGPNSWTLARGGEILACAGVSELYRNVGEAWSILGMRASRHMLAIHRFAAGILEMAPQARVSTFVKCDFDEGHRWIQMLGFELEAPRCRKVGPDGDDYALYALVR